LPLLRADKARLGRSPEFFGVFIMKKRLFAHLAVIALATGSGMASAAGPDLTSLTSAVDFGTTTTAILAIAALLAAVFVAIRAAKTVLGMIKGR
jgi:hypothetical protein